MEETLLVRLGVSAGDGVPLADAPNDCVVVGVGVMVLVRVDVSVANDVGNVVTLLAALLLTLALVLALTLALALLDILEVVEIDGNCEVVSRTLGEGNVEGGKVCDGNGLDDKMVEIDGESL